MDNAPVEREGVVTTRLDRVMPHVPALRRYAYVSTGSREAGDALVRACLQVVVAAPEMLDETTSRVELFRIFHRVNGAPVLGPPVEPGRRIDAVARLFLQLVALEREARAGLILTCVIGMSDDEAAWVLGREPAELRATVTRARAQLARLAGARVLIIEDDYLAAQDIARIVAHLGQQVSGPAATYQEAFACAAEAAPNLVLADIQLRDGRIAGLLAGQALAQKHGVPLIVITGYPERVAQVPEADFLKVLTKPFDDASLRSAICSSLAAPRLPAGPSVDQRHDLLA